MRIKTIAGAVIAALALALIALSSGAVMHHTRASVVHAKLASYEVVAPLTRRVPKGLVGKRLDRAEIELESNGIGFRTIGGDVFLRADWGVCATIPRAGQPIHGAVKLIIGHFSCGA